MIYIYTLHVHIHTRNIYIKSVHIYIHVYICIAAFFCCVREENKNTYTCICTHVYMNILSHPVFFCTLQHTQETTHTDTNTEIDTDTNTDTNTDADTDIDTEARGWMGAFHILSRPM